MTRNYISLMSVSAEKQARAIIALVRVIAHQRESPSNIGEVL
jgi:hypothetical protein